VICPQAVKQKVRASLVDLQGRVINYWVLSQGQVRHPLMLPSKIRSGIYLLVLEGEGFRQTFKVVISPQDAK
jgi:hypothetical protein